MVHPGALHFGKPRLSPAYPPPQPPRESPRQIYLLSRLNLTRRAAGRLRTEPCHTPHIPHITVVRHLRSALRMAAAGDPFEDTVTVQCLAALSDLNTLDTHSAAACVVHTWHAPRADSTTLICKQHSHSAAFGSPVRPEHPRRTPCCSLCCAYVACTKH